MKARLQLRWERDDPHVDSEGWLKWKCFYELVIPLRENDIRSDVTEEEPTKVVLIGVTPRRSMRSPCMLDEGGYWFDTPLRDGAHALWDAEHLGNLPVVCIAVDGTVIEQSEHSKLCVARFDRMFEDILARNPHLGVSLQQ
jgi:hypothetical protein